MTIVTIQEAQADLLGLVHKLAPGDEVVITRTISRWLSWWHLSGQAQPMPGRCKGC